MADFDRRGPYLVAHADDWKLSLLTGVDDIAERPCDFEVEFDDGRRYGGVVATLEQLRAMMTQWRSTGECLNGQFIWISNLVIVERLDPDLLVEVVKDLVRSGEISAALKQATDD